MNQFQTSALAPVTLAALLVGAALAHAGDRDPPGSERDPRTVMNAVHRRAGEGTARAGRLRLTTTPSGGAARERVMQMRYWTPRRLVIRTVESGKVRSETVLETLELKADPSVSDADFTKQRLELGP